MWICVFLFSSGVVDNSKCGPGPVTCSFVLACKPDFYLMQFCRCTMGVNVVTFCYGSVYNGIVLSGVDLKIGRNFRKNFGLPNFFFKNPRNYFKYDKQ